MNGTESVWDYPRPPRMEAAARRLRIIERGVVLVDTEDALRVLETSHPPVYYLPPAALRMDLLRRSASRQSFCEFKGLATYWSFRHGDGRDVAWSYEQPTASFGALAGFLAFYASRVEECWVDNERVAPQEGDFYGGWITSDLRGPFKGAAGTRGW